MSNMAPTPTAYKPKLLTVKTLEEAKSALRAVNCEEEGVRLMANKCILEVIKLHGVRNAIANILKQEMLAVGGDAAVSRDTINCKDPTTDVVLMATLKQYLKVIAKMKGQVSECRDVAHAIQAALSSKHKKLA
jgi:dihydropteroate synthase